MNHRGTQISTPATSSMLKILVVEDNPVLRTTANLSVKKTLEQKGISDYAIHLAEHGHQALETMKAYPGRYDLIITDKDMPQMCGLELLSHLGKHKDVPGRAVFLFSATLDHKVIEKARLHYPRVVCRQKESNIPEIIEEAIEHALQERFYTRLKDRELTKDEIQRVGEVKRIVNELYAKRAVSFSNALGNWKNELIDYQVFITDTIMFHLASKSTLNSYAKYLDHEDFLSVESFVRDQYSQTRKSE
ncbi:MAG: response regulator [Nanoarchaeota archaeon]